MAIHRRAAKRDGNEPEIIRALLAVGATVEQVSKENAPDLDVGFRGQDYKIEVKMPGKHLLPGQEAWHEAWQGRRPIVAHSVEEALGGIGAI